MMNEKIDVSVQQMLDRKIFITTKQTYYFIINIKIVTLQVKKKKQNLIRATKDIELWRVMI